jgi:c-di-GMP-binding flagellar brake protein YcgR
MVSDSSVPPSEKVSALLSDLSLGGLGLTINKGAPLYDNIKTDAVKVLKVYDRDSGVLRSEIKAEVRHIRDIDEDKAFVGLMLRK